MTACDYCLSDCFDSSHSLGDEDCGPSCECFHVDLGGLDEGNHLGMLEDGDPPRPAPRVDILRELAVVPVPAGGQDAQLEQIREVQARLDEEAGQLVQLRQNIGQDWAGRAPAGEARHLAQDVQHRIADDARARLPLACSGVGQNLATAVILLRAMPEPSTTEGRRIQGELKNLLEDAVVRRAESSASRRQGYPPEHRAATSRFMREASVYTGRTRNTAPAAPGRLGNEHHRRDRRAHLDEKVRRGNHPRRGGRYDKKEDHKAEEFPEVHDCFMIYGGQVANASARHRKQERREFCLVKVAAPVYLDWFDKPITIDQGDHPDRVPSPGKYPLVVDLVIGNVRLTKGLMDGGSSLNIIYAETLGLLQIDLSSIRAGTAPFHEIIPGKRVQPLGQLDLPVCFGTPSNFRKETLTFEVVWFRGTYHAVLGRPCYAKFMAVPNYTYLKLKMSGPNRVITVGSTYRHAYECDVECVEYAEALAESEALIADLESLSKEAPDAKRHAGNFEPAETVKFVPLDPSNDASKQIRIGSELDPR
jgi:hypothetical protein